MVRPFARSLFWISIAGECTMIQMDANTRKLEKETREIRDSLHVDLALFLNFSSRSLFEVFVF